MKFADEQCLTVLIFRFKFSEIYLGPLIIFCDVEFVPYKIKLENEFVDYSTPKSSFVEIFKQGILTDCVFETSFSIEYIFDLIIY